MVQERAKIVEAPPIRIEPQIVTVQKSERVEKERQTTLFQDLPDTNLPPLNLLDEAPPAQETVSVETLEFRDDVFVEIVAPVEDLENVAAVSSLSRCCSVAPGEQPHGRSAARRP